MALLEAKTRSKLKKKLSTVQTVNRFRIDLASFLLGSDRILKYQEFIFPLSIVQNLALSNRRLIIVRILTNFNHFVYV